MYSNSACRRLACASALLLSLASQLGAQDSQPCSYDACAVRLEGGRLVAGIEGRRVGRVGLFGASGLDSLIARSDSAAAHVRTFRTHQGISGVLGVVAATAAVAYVVSLTSGIGSGDASAGVPEVLTATSIGASLFAARARSRAQTGLSRAIWWHNRDLPR